MTVKNSKTPSVAPISSNTLFIGSVSREADDWGSSAAVDHHHDEIASDSLPGAEDPNSESEHPGSGNTDASSRVSRRPVSQAGKEGAKMGCLYRLAVRFPRFHRLVLSWPRTCSLILGVILPLFVLIFISVVIGIILSIIEAPLEVARNDNVLATDVQTYDGLILISEPLFSEESAFLPSICLELYSRHQNASLIEKYVLDLLKSESDALKALNLTDPFEVNETAVADYLDECGEFARPIMERLEQDNNTIFSIIGDALTFNWIRCIPGAKGLRTVAGMASLNMIPQMRYDAQKKHYIDVWRKDQKELYDRLYEEEIAANMSSVNASMAALQESVRQASGVRGCELNAPASGK
jgi:hypothetical protein